MSQGKPRPTVVKLHEMKAGSPPADLFALLTEKLRGSTRDGKPFYSCKFRDHRRTVSTVIWADSKFYHDCDKAWVAGSIYKLRANYTEHEKYGPQIEIHMIRDVTEIDKDDGLVETDFFERSRVPPDELFVELRNLAETELKNPYLRKLTLALLDEHKDLLKILPASHNRYYLHTGGWLEHTLNVARNCLWLGRQYAERQPDLKSLDVDLLLAAALLHEFGRVRELAVTRPGQLPELTVEGRLYGPVHLSRDIVNEAAREIPEFPTELRWALESVIMSYLERPEWGSPRLPVLPEALILHHADDLDAKFEMYARCLTRDQSGGPFTERDPVLGKSLWKRADRAVERENEGENGGENLGDKSS